MATSPSLGSPLGGAGGSPTAGGAGGISPGGGSVTRRSASGSGPFVGPRQPTESRMAESAVWVRATRPGPGSYEPRVAEKTVKPVSPKWSMQGTGHAPNLNPSYCAGDYDLTRVGSVGGDSAVSKHRSPPKSTFGTSRRDDSSAMYSVFTVKPK